MELAPHHSYCIHISGKCALGPWFRSKIESGSEEWRILHK